VPAELGPDLIALHASMGDHDTKEKLIIFILAAKILIMCNGGRPWLTLPEGEGGG
jgi:hypothetical protein